MFPSDWRRAFWLSFSPEMLLAFLTVAKKLRSVSLTQANACANCSPALPGSCTFGGAGNITRIIGITRHNHTHTHITRISGIKGVAICQEKRPLHHWRRFIQIFAFIGRAGVLSASLVESFQDRLLPERHTGPKSGRGRRAVFGSSGRGKGALLGLWWLQLGETLNDQFSLAYNSSSAVFCRVGLCGDVLHVAGLQVEKKEAGQSASWLSQPS